MREQLWVQTFLCVRLYPSETISNFLLSIIWWTSRLQIFTAHFSIWNYDYTITGKKMILHDSIIFVCFIVSKNHEDPKETKKKDQKIYRRKKLKFGEGFLVSLLKKNKKKNQNRNASDYRNEITQFNIQSLVAQKWVLFWRFSFVELMKIADELNPDQKVDKNG